MSLGGVLVSFCHFSMAFIYGCGHKLKVEM